MSLEDYVFALQYAKITYIRRDVLFAMSGKKKKGNDKKLNLKIEQPAIEAWVAKQYENVKENTRV